MEDPVTEEVISVFDEANKKRHEKYGWLDRSLWKILLGIGAVDMANVLLIGALVYSDVNIFRTAEFFRSLFTVITMGACSYASKTSPKQALVAAAVIYFVLLAATAYFYPGVLYVGFKIRVLTIILFALLLGIRVF